MTRAQEIPSGVARKAAVIAAARDRLLAALRPLVAEAPAVALLDFPAHGNVGDSAIWLGALAALRAAGAPTPAYTCDAGNYNRVALARAVGTGTIFFTGGGSFGDLWEKHLRFRESVVADFPDNPIVQLPESVCFLRPESLARSRSVFNAHRHVTLMARDTASLAIFRDAFSAPSHLAPDLAFMLGALERPALPVRDVLWLKRDDKEDLWAGMVEVETVDWVQEPQTRLIRWSRRLRQAADDRPALRPLDRGLQPLGYPFLAAQRLARGVALLSSARVVVTDRLHAHILALLLGIPHVVLDNSYGKLHNFIAAWTHASPMVHMASDPAAAAAQAHALLAEA